MKERRTLETPSRPLALRSVRKLHARVSVWRSCRTSLPQRRELESEDEEYDDPDSSETSNNPAPASPIKSSVKPGAKLIRRRNCHLCQLPHGEGTTSIQKLRSGASSGRRCCATILDAIMTWYQSPHRRLSKSLRELQLQDATISLNLAWGRFEPFIANSIINLEWCVEDSSVRTKKIKLCLQRPEDLLREGVNVSALPRTFRDAVLVCLRLGLRFLWIDALRIIQDSPKDWKEAVANMADIYENGFLTIAATASRNSESGCFSSRDSPFWPLKLAQSILHVSQYQFPQDEFGDCPLLDRAWVFQERRLSTRIVHFTDLQLIWECSSMRRSESGHIDCDWTNEKLFSSRSFKGIYPFKKVSVSTALRWQVEVQNYSGLCLTNVSDRLPALAAIVKRTMRARPTDVYIVGMWTGTLLHDLLWYHLCTGGNVPPRPDVKVPTWSWASVAGQVYFRRAVVLLAKVLSIAYEHIGPPQLGNVINASITLQGRFCTASIMDTSINLYPLRLGPDLNPIGLECLIRLNAISCNFYSDYEFRPIQTTEDVLVLFVGYVRRANNNIAMGLVLRRISPSEHERIGFCEMYHTSESPKTQRKAKLKDNFSFRLSRHIISSMPFGQFKII
ncbi:hypothetical protein OPT61_g2254 [Boeremia exigua]|uniref:Uncharacterized protein n=1 Tax=Boeremia exigua TaxID=749465 RepID=A0ACC2IM69_9PLEO|nr:hypothetical protein OPT61_g2254 [Boeremia exigua]